MPVKKPKHTTTTTEVPKPWLRTISSTIKEIVTPTVIAGVTFSAKPLETPDPLQPWISLKKDGTPQTIKPEIKKGRTVKASPDYSTYFKTAYTTTYSYEDLQAHNMDADEHLEEEVFVDEDSTYISLNPVIRCTPDTYFKKGIARDISSEPFCTPRENSVLKVDHTYFVTWYTRFFRDEVTEETIDQVRLHLFAVKEKAHDKGFKRNLNAAFFSSEWLKNVDGLYPLEVSEDWLDGKYERKALLAIQPRSIPDDEFNPLEYGLLVEVSLGSRVFKNTKEQLALQDEGITDESWYYVAMTMPTIVLFACVAMYFFLYLSKDTRDVSDVKRYALGQKRRVLGKLKDMKKFKGMKNHAYNELPTYRKNSKQS